MGRTDAGGDLMRSSRERGGLADVQRWFDQGTVAGMTDGELLGRFVLGRDEVAFQAILARHGPTVLGVCRRWLHDPADVEDAFQATILILLRKASSIRDPQQLGPWLYGVAYRVARRARKLAARRDEHDRARALTPGTDREPPEQAELRQALDQEILRLPASLRLPIVLCHLDGLTQPEAASRLRLTPASIRGRLARGRQKLKDRLTRRGFALPGGLVVLDLAAESARGVVPPPLVAAALRLLTANATPAPMVTLLTHGVLRAMHLNQLRWIAAALIGIGTLAAGAATRAGRALESEPNPRSTPPEPSTPPARAAGLDRQPRLVLVEARDLRTDAPVPDVALDLSLGKNEHLPARTDQAGNATLTLPAAHADRWFSLTATRAGFVPLANRSDREPIAPATPYRFLFQMEPATTASGRVFDEDRQPVADATVLIDVKKRYPKSAQWVDLRSETTRTDASGRWSFVGIPAEPDAVQLASSHPLHLTGATYLKLENFEPLAALRNGSAVLGLNPRGTLIRGRVVGTDDRPVPNATVFFGEGRRFGNSIPPCKADEQGQFRFGVKPGTITSLTAQAPGHGPAGQELRVGVEPQQVTLKLAAPQVLSGRVVDRGGKGVTGASVMVGWSPTGPPRAGRSSETIAHELTTDAEGRFAWTEAPTSAVCAEVWAEGYQGLSDLVLAPGQANQFVLTASTPVKGTVTDAATGQPVPRFTILFGSIRRPGERLIWQRIYGLDEQAKKAAGSFEVPFTLDQHQCLVRVEGEGYLPEDSPLFELDGRPRDFTFRLTHAAPIEGTVANSDGRPAAGAIVYLVPANEQARLVNGELASGDRTTTIQTKVEADGRFMLSPRRDDYLLFALSDVGIAVHRRGERRLVLQAWGQVAGAVQVGGKRSVGLDLSGSPDAKEEPWSLDAPRLLFHYFVRTDQEGRFQLPRVAPGRHTFGQSIPDGMPGRQRFVELAAVDVPAGRAVSVQIGASGHAVEGKLALLRVPESSDANFVIDIWGGTNRSDDPRRQTNLSP